MDIDSWLSTPTFVLVVSSRNSEPFKLPAVGEKLPENTRNNVTSYNITGYNNILAHFFDVIDRRNGFRYIFKILNRDSY